MKNRNILSLILILFITGMALLSYFQPGSKSTSAIYGNVMTLICGALAILGTFMAYRCFRSSEKAKRSWGLITLGITLFFIGDFIYAFLEVFLKLDMDNLFPSSADIFYVSSYLPMIIGMLYFTRLYLKSGLPLESWKKAITFFSAGYLVLLLGIFVFIFKPIFIDDSTGTLAKAVYFFYPAADLLLIIPSLLLVYLTGLMGKGFYSRPWQMIATGFLFMSVGDLLYSYLSWNGSYQSGSLIDLGWNLAYLFIGAAGYFQMTIMKKPLEGGK